MGNSDQPPPSKRVTAPPPFDAEEFAQESERLIRVAAIERHRKPTTRVDKMPNLRAKVRLAVSAVDLEWLDLSDAARDLAETIDGEKTVMELLEAPDGKNRLAVFAELMEQGVLAFDE